MYISTVADHVAYGSMFDDESGAILIKVGNS